MIKQYPLREGRGNEKMICEYCKYANFQLTPKTLKRAMWGTGKCTAKWDIPTINISKIPAVVKVTLTITEPVIDQDLITLDNPDLNKQYGVQKCPLFERKTPQKIRGVRWL